MADLYSLNQITYGALLGGPAAAAYCLATNFLHMGDNEERRRVIALGVGATIILPMIFIPLPELPDPVRIFIALSMVTVAYRIAKHRQHSYVLNQVSKGLPLVSNFKVVYVVFLGIVVEFSIFVAWVTIFKLSGYEII